MISSTVSSKILKTMAKAEGFSFVETLTGFKWMGNKADELMKNGKTGILSLLSFLTHLNYYLVFGYIHVKLRNKY